MCDDTSSELQRMAVIDRRGLTSQNSFRGRGAMSRLVSMVVTLREWAHKSLVEEQERPDSFLERFRGPDLQAPPSRISQSRPDAEPTDHNDHIHTKSPGMLILSPADNIYYHWLLIISTAVLYNWCLLVARWRSLTVSVRFRDRAKSGRIKVTILPESKRAVVSFPLALTRVTGEGPHFSAQHALSKPQGRPVATSLAEAEGIGTLRAGQFQAMCPSSPHS
nr:cyclic nucleotide-gated channel cone photoreceptor subunit alpha-like [Oncorhynchus nerka]